VTPGPAAPRLSHFPKERVDELKQNYNGGIVGDWSKLLRFRKKGRRNKAPKNPERSTTRGSRSFFLFIAAFRGPVGFHRDSPRFGSLGPQFSGVIRHHSNLGSCRGHAPAEMNQGQFRFRRHQNAQQTVHGVDGCEPPGTLATNCSARLLLRK
jgi:hypothetical protein